MVGTRMTIGYSGTQSGARMGPGCCRTWASAQRDRPRRTGVRRAHGPAGSAMATRSEGGVRQGGNGDRPCTRRDQAPRALPSTGPAQGSARKCRAASPSSSSVGALWGKNESALGGGRSQDASRSHSMEFGARVSVCKRVVAEERVGVKSKRTRKYVAHSRKVLT